MTVETEIFDVLKGLVSNRVYPVVAPSNPTKPYIVFQQVGGDSVTFLNSEVPSKENGRFQIVAWATTPAEAKSLIKQAESALILAVTIQAMPLGAAAARYDATTVLHGSQQDFSVWADR